jgi:hypothetical protein
MGKDLMKETPITQEIRARIDKWDCVKLRIFCTAMEIVNRVKIQHREWEKVCAT